MCIYLMLIELLLVLMFYSSLLGVGVRWLSVIVCRLCLVSWLLWWYVLLGRLGVSVWCGVLGFVW